MDLPPEQLDDALSEEHPEDAAETAEQKAFHNCLLQQARAAGAECGANCLLACAGHGPRQHQTGHVEAGQRPDAEDHRVEQQQRLAQTLVQRLLITGDFNARGQIAVRDFLRGHGLRAAHLIRKLRGCHVIRQPHIKIPPRLMAAAHRETTRHHAEDGVGLLFDGESFAHDPRIAVVELAPGALAEQRDAIAAGIVLLGAKASA